MWFNERMYCIARTYSLPKERFLGNENKKMQFNDKICCIASNKCQGSFLSCNYNLKHDH